MCTLYTCLFFRNLYAVLCSYIQYITITIGIYVVQPKISESLAASESEAADTTLSPWLSSAFSTARPSNNMSDPSTAMDIDSGAGGNDQEEFASNERAVLERPNESAHWLAYVAALVQRGRLAAARALIERALNTIHFRYLVFLFSHLFYLNTLYRTNKRIYCTYCI